jgi:prepilin-type N-terminal cleavage/methylation domain-containing protein
MHRRSNGYTLVELMIVVAILGILAMIAIPAYRDYITTGRQGTARANIESLRIAIEDYHLDNLNAGYGGIDGVWDPGVDDSLKTGVLGWKPDGDRDEYKYEVKANATGTGYTITVTPIGHTADAQTFTK